MINLLMAIMSLHMPQQMLLPVIEVKPLIVIEESKPLELSRPHGVFVPFTLGDI